MKVTIGRREDWEMAVREADEALKQTSETRLEEIEPKVQFYTVKLGMIHLYEKINSTFSFFQLLQKVNPVVNQKLQ